LGLPNPSSQSYAHQLLGRYYLDRNQTDEALNQLNQALAQKVEGEQETAVARHQSALYHLRSQAHRRRQNYQQALQDIQQAITLATQTGDEKLIAHYRDEQATIQNHAGQTAVADHQPPATNN
jgi:tetratricopeptide (TPR) repeat protein